MRDLNVDIDTELSHFLLHGLLAPLLGASLVMGARIEQSGLLLPASLLVLATLTAAAFFWRGIRYGRGWERMRTYRGTGGEGEYLGGYGAGGIGLSKALDAQVVTRQVNHGHSICPA
jgi:hypothetical protein